MKPLEMARECLETIRRDRDRLDKIDRYHSGDHDDPYMPEDADDEYRLLAKRSRTNWTPLLVQTPCQALYVDGFRPGRNRQGALAPEATRDQRSPEWDHWQRSRLDARQVAIYHGALLYGHSFAVTEKGRGGKVRTRGLSPRRTAALYDDPANDDAPVCALTVTAWSQGDKPGRATLWDETHTYEIRFKTLGDKDGVRVSEGRPHGNSECPVTRFAAWVDLEGRTTGVVEPLIPVQDRINQSVFDLLVGQTYAAIKVRTVSGMKPDVVRDPETGEPVIGPDGREIVKPIRYSGRRFMMSPDHDAKFGTLDETPLGGFIESIDMSIRHLSAMSQTPPHHLLGQIANLSAEALLAAETALARKVAEFKAVFGEAWERVFRLAAELGGERAAVDDYHGEVLWRDMESRSLAATADALAKLRELGIPLRGLWRRIPGVTQDEIEDWEEMAEDEDPMAQIASRLTAASGSSTRSLPADQVPVAA